MINLISTRSKTMASEICKARLEIFLDNRLPKMTVGIDPKSKFINLTHLPFQQIDTQLQPPSLKEWPNGFKYPRMTDALIARN